MRVALVTGANTGIGLVTARVLVQEGWHVFIACRSAEKAQAAIEHIRKSGGSGQVEFLALDLGNFNSVRQCAETFLARGLPLHLLVNNAGVAGARGLTDSGFELAFGTNHMGHFLLTKLLLERIKQSAPARIVTVSSMAHGRKRGIQWGPLTRPTKTKTGLFEYGVSKLANALFSAELGRRLAGTGVTTYALHPGAVASDVWRSSPQLIQTLANRLMISPEKGAATSLYCALSPDVSEQTGWYYEKCRPKKPSRAARDKALAAQLWERSEQWVA